MAQNSAPIEETGPGFWLHKDVAKLIDRSWLLLDAKIMSSADAYTVIRSTTHLEWTVHDSVEELCRLHDKGFPLPTAPYEPTGRQFRANPTFHNFCGFCARFAKWLDRAELKYRRALEAAL